MTNNISTLFNKSLTEMNISDKQKAVLQACLMLFSEKGFENTSTSDIAKLAGVAEGTVYKKFKTKKKLLQVVIDSIINEVMPNVANEFINELTKLKVLHFQEFLQNIIQNRLQFFINNLPQIRILIRESMTNDKIRQQIIKNISNLNLEKLNIIFEYYQQQGQIVNWQISRTCQYILGTIGSYLAPLIFSTNYTIDVTRVSQEAAEFLMRGLRLA